MANPTTTQIMTPARGPNVPDAQPIYLVDPYGNVMSEVESAANAGKMYSVSTANFAVTAGGLYAGISLFWAARASKIIVISAKAQNSASVVAHRLHRTTTDPALSGLSIAGLAIRSMLIGQPGSAANLTSATEAVSNATGTLHRSVYTGTGNNGELLSKPSDYLIIPPNVAGGVLLLINGASANGVLGELIWCEI